MKQHDSMKMVYVVPKESLQVAKRPFKAKVPKDENLYNSLKFFMVFSQALGILPQENVCTNFNEMRFTWKSWKTIYTLFLIILSEFGVGCCISAWFNSGYLFDKLIAQIFFLTSTFTLILHLRLAKHWPELITSWCKMDKIMNATYGYPATLDRRLKVFTLLFMGLAITDGSLSAASRHTNLSNKLGDRYNYTHYFEDAFPELFNVLPVNVVTAVYCGVLIWQATLLWAYNDVFIILLSTPLALRFRQITKRLEDAQRKTRFGARSGKTMTDLA
ncbi:unnamed protein product [Acanthoscelides obtectus]|uniref:Uncharacterized protein n=1 Tax=Acanthoscelides obtectus TaxID=200917 RepID=A0A9P0K280_ACAOB|nr:unnamed protein product [Acanthoscelides obtectus]CAK1629664.1 Gustatory receptor for sugar taste 64a [Acanthoscelides obtectus]